MPCSSGVTSVSKNKNLKGQWKRRARMSQAVSREGAAVILYGLEGERLKREREDMQLNTQAGLEMQQTKKGKLGHEQSATVQSEVEETSHNWSQAYQ